MDNPSTDSVANLRGVGRRIRFLQDGVRRASDIGPALAGVDGPVHFGALISGRGSPRRPLLVDAINAKATLRLLSPAIQRPMQRLAFASSSVV